MQELAFFNDCGWHGTLHRQKERKSEDELGLGLWSLLGVFFNVVVSNPIAQSSMNESNREPRSAKKGADHIRRRRRRPV
jgi:hypothetical protein